MLGIIRSGSAARLFLCGVIMSLLAFGLFSETYRLDSLRFEIVGRTRESALRSAADIELGKTFPDKASLDAFVGDRRQLLINERALESVEIETMQGSADSYGLVPVELVIKTRDTWNIVVLPYFKYDSNTGLLLAGRGRDYNFMGSLEALILNLNWLLDNQGKSQPGVEAKFSLPFSAAGLDWNWNFDADFVMPEGMKPDLGLSTMLSVGYPLGPGSLNAGVEQGAYFNNRDSSGQAYDDATYLESAFAAWYELVLLRLPRLGELSLSPRLDVFLLWNPAEALRDSSLDSGLGLTPSVTLGFGRIDWIGNFRRGLSASTSLSYTYYPEEARSSTVLSWTAAAYGAFSRFGPSARFGGFVRDAIDTSAGDDVRGVLDSRIDADVLTYLNLDLPMSVIRFRPSSWFGRPWMRFFEFEQQWSPFLDAAFVRNPESGRLFSPDEAWYGGGLEVITFPRIMRSFYLRVSAAWSLPDVLEKRSLSGKSARDGASISEYFIGMGHHY